jgi:3-isopropylmalate dehydrogenase
MGIFEGEGIGPEVIGAALRMLDALESVRPLGIARWRGGAIGWQGEPGAGEVTGEAAAFCGRVFDAGGAILCGPGGGRFVYDLRRRFDLFCKIAPLKPASPLHGASRMRAEVVRGVDIVIVRDNAGGLYQGTWDARRESGEGCGDLKGAADGRVARHAFSYSERQVRRIVEVGAALARGEGRRRRMHVVIKDGGVPAISQLWREVAETRARAGGVECICMNADYAAYQMLQHPEEFDIVVTPNMIGDMLADLGAVLLGSRGLSYSANFSGEGRAVYQTGHGSAHDLAGTDRANPAAQMLTLAMMLRESYGMADEARLIEQALENVWQAGWRTSDLLPAWGAAGGGAGTRRVGTREMGELVAEAVVALVENPVAA